MVIRVHAWIAAHLVTVPAFPHRRGAVADQVTPRRIVGIQHQSVCKIAVSGLDQRSQQVRRTEKPCPKQTMIRFYFCCELFCCGRAQLFGDKVHVQRQHIACLGVAAFGLRVWIVDLTERRRAVVRTCDKAVRMHKLLNKCSANVVEQFCESLLLVLLAEGMGHLPHQRDVVCPIGRGHQRILRWPFR